MATNISGRATSEDYLKHLKRRTRMEKKLNVVLKMAKGSVLSIIIVFIITGFTAHALAQQYPVKPITVVVGMAAGGMSDLVQRFLANEAKKYLGVEILVMNKPGAVQTVAAGYVVSCQPDGYTLGGIVDGVYVRSPYFMELNYNPFTDTTPIIWFQKQFTGHYVRADSPFKTMKDVFKFAEENPGKLTHGTMGISTQAYLNMEAFALQKGFKVAEVPFNGDLEVITALLGGQIMVGAGGTGSFRSHAKAGKVRLLAISEGYERYMVYPEVPTLYELGFKDVLPSGSQLLLVGPKGLPEPIVKKIEDAYKKASESAGFKQLAQDNDFLVITKGNTGQELRDYLEKSYQIHGNLIQKLGLSKTKPK